MCVMVVFLCVTVVGWIQTVGQIHKKLSVCSGKATNSSRTQPLGVSPRRSTDMMECISVCQWVNVHIYLFYLQSFRLLFVCCMLFIFRPQDSGFPPVGELRDPRPRRLWSRYTELSLPVPKFKVRILGLVFIWHVSGAFCLIIFSLIL